MEANLDALLRIFVYGSLKRGYRNHAKYCAGFGLLCPATVLGKLYRQADGYPMLVVPQSAILAVGSADHAYDLQRLAQFEEQFKRGQTAVPSQPDVAVGGGPWEEIRGEILEWPDSAGAARAEMLARLDRLEDFYATDSSPAAVDSLYDRVILLARHEQGESPVWTYVAPAGKLPLGAVPMGKSWP